MLKLFITVSVVVFITSKTTVAMENANSDISALDSSLKKLTTEAHPFSDDESSIEHKDYSLDESIESERKMEALYDSLDFENKMFALRLSLAAMKPYVGPTAKDVPSYDSLFTELKDIKQVDSRSKIFLEDSTSLAKIKKTNKMDLLEQSTVSTKNSEFCAEFYGSSSFRASEIADENSLLYNALKETVEISAHIQAQMKLHLSDSEIDKIEKFKKELMSDITNPTAVMLRLFREHESHIKLMRLGELIVIWHALVKLQEENFFFLNDPRVQKHTGRLFSVSRDFLEIIPKPSLVWNILHPSNQCLAAEYGEAKIFTQLSSFTKGLLAIYMYETNIK